MWWNFIPWLKVECVPFNKETGASAERLYYSHSTP